MDSRTLTAAPFRLLDWRIDPARGALTPLAGGEPLRPDARAFQLLLHLAARPGVVISIDELLDEVWAGVVVSPDSVYQAITALRRMLGDDPKAPRYIATVPRQGYRLVATPQPDAVEPVAAAVVEPVAAVSPPPPSTPPTPAPPRPRRQFIAAALGLAAAGAALAVWAPWHAAAPGPLSIAVLPFMDLTDAMDQEPFADGMTEQLIDTLSHRPGWQIPALSRVLPYKGKDVPLAQIGRELGVQQVLEGSVRRSGDTLRVSTRLVRADNGFVAWSSSFDRPAADRLAVQADVATQVDRALGAALSR